MRLSGRSTALKLCQKKPESVRSLADESFSFSPLDRLNKVYLHWLSKQAVHLGLKIVEVWTVHMLRVQRLIFPVLVEHEQLRVVYSFMQVIVEAAFFFKGWRDKFLEYFFKVLLFARFRFNADDDGKGFVSYMFLLS